jgi:hypothetical protein
VSIENAGATTALPVHAKMDSLVVNGAGEPALYTTRATWQSLRVSRHRRAHSQFCSLWLELQRRQCLLVTLKKVGVAASRDGARGERIARMC